MKKFTFILLLSCIWNISFAQDNIKRPDTYNYQCGVEAYGKEDYASSMEFFNKELEVNPNNGYAMIWKSYIYDKFERYGDAITNASKGIKYIPKKDKEWIGIGHDILAKLNAELGDTLKAYTEYDLAFKADGKTSHLFDKCNILNEQERYADIDVEIKKAMAVNDKDAVVWVYAGRNDYKKGNVDSSIEKYSYATKLAPNYASAFSFRAEVYISQKRFKEASQDVITALSIDQDSKAFVQLYILSDSALNILIPQLRAQQKKERRECMWSYYLGVCYSHAGKYVEAEQAWREAERIANEEGNPNRMIYVNLAEVLNQLGRYNEAIDMSDKCIGLDSTYVRAFVCRHFSYYLQGKNMAAIETLNNAIRIAPDYDILYGHRARIYMYSGQIRNALDDINTALALAPEELSYYNQRAEIYKRMKKDADAIADCNHVIISEQSKSFDSRDNVALVYAYARSGRKSDCIPLIQTFSSKAINMSDEYEKACLYGLIGEIELSLKHFENSLRLGNREFVHFENDTDIDCIKTTDKYKKLIEEYKEKSVDGSPIAKDVNVMEYEEVTNEVPFTKDNGVTKVKCTINDLPLHFIFDTGASDVTISSVEAQFMLKNDYLKPTDIKGKEYYGTASGDIAEGTVIILRKVSFGGMELDNVKASVVHNQQAPLLLGQTVLNRLGKIEIDYGRNMLKITSKKRR